MTPFTLPYQERRSILVKQSRTLLFVTAYFFLSLFLTAVSVRNPETAQVGSILFQSIATPVERTVIRIWDNVESVWDGYLWLVGTRRENQLLLTEVSRLESEVVRLRELSQESMALREILELRKQTGFGGVVASVIGADPSGWIQSVTIDRGKVDGIKVDMPAVLGGAVVGQVRAVSSSASNVLVITDRSSGVGALIQRSRARGIVVGSGGNECFMEYVQNTEDVAIGDTVVTSGLDGIYPKGLEIGTVIEIQSPPGEMFQRIRIAPSVNHERLETLFILTSYN